MAEKENSPKTKIPPNVVPRHQAIREGMGLPSKLTMEEDKTDYTRINGRAENRVRIITYAVDAPAKEAYKSKKSMTLTAVTDPKHLIEIERVMGDFERLANIRYERVSREAAKNADIVIFTTPYISQTTAGYASVGQGQRYIVIQNDQFDHTFAHELGHAMGFSHKDHVGQVKEQLKNGIKDQISASGDSKKYNNDGTVMSYIPGMIQDSDRYLGPYDIDQLQEFYGAPLNTSPDHISKPGNGPSTLYSDMPITLDYRGTAQSQEITLPAVADGDSTKGIRFVDMHRVDYDTDIKNVVASGAIGSMAIEGNALPNILIGGDGYNRLTAVGNGDTLVGNSVVAPNNMGGHDTFIITDGSRQTLIDNLTKYDDIELPEATRKVKLQYVDTGYTKTTQAAVFDAKGSVIATFAVMNSKPSEVEATLVSLAKPSVTVLPDRGGFGRTKPAKPRNSPNKEFDALLAREHPGSGTPLPYATIKPGITAGFGMNAELETESPETLHGYTHVKKAAATVALSPEDDALLTTGNELEMQAKNAADRQDAIARKLAEEKRAAEKPATANTGSNAAITPAPAGETPPKNELPLNGIMSGAAVFALLALVTNPIIALIAALAVGFGVHHFSQPTAGGNKNDAPQATPTGAREGNKHANPQHIRVRENGLYGMADVKEAGGNGLPETAKRLFQPKQAAPAR